MTIAFLTRPAVEQERPPYTWLLPLGVMACVTVARMIYVSLYGAAIPFWDQWDELNRLIGPWMQHTWHAAQLFSPHNEHRIAFTRLITLALFKANGGIWDNLVESYVNTMICACMFALLYRLLCRCEARRAVRWAMFVAVVAIGSLPFDWENILVGFQNQFYLMELSAVAMVGIAAYRRASRSTLWLLLLLGTASLFTMAAGVLAAAAVCGVVILRGWCESLRPTFLLSALAGMLLVIVGGLVLLPHGASNDAFVARGLQEHFRAWITALMWPMQGFTWTRSLFALLIWSPTLLWLLRILCLRQAKSSEIFVIGIGLWVLLQTLAIAHARGHGLISLPSRYMGILAIGLLANLWLTLQMLGRPLMSSIPAFAGTTIAVLSIVLVAVTLAGRSRGDLMGMQHRYSLSQLEARNTRGYLANDNFMFLQQPALLIPYPDARKLQNFLDDPSIRAALPQSVRPQKTATHGSVNADDMSTSRPDGWLSIGAGKIQSSLRHLSGRLGMAVPSTLYKELPSTSAPDGAGKSSEAICALDQINFATPQSVTTADANGSLQVTGWLVDARKNAPVNFMLMLVGPKTYQIEGNADMPRIDVAAALHSATASNAGFTVLGTLNRAAPGTYEIKLKIKGTTDLLEGVCDTHHQVVVGNYNQIPLGTSNRASASFY